MTKVLQENRVAELNIVSLKDPETGDVPAVCVAFAKRCEATPPAQARGLEGPTSCARPTCRPQSYPAGCTLLECRLKGDQPLAQVVQVPCTSTAAEPKICLLVETRQSASGPFSRVTSRPCWNGHVKDGCSEICQRHEQAPPVSFTLESHESPHGAVATACKVPVKNDTPCRIITKMETREAECRDGPTSKILCESTTDKPSRGTCSREPCTSPLTRIECTVTEDGPLARVIQCPKSEYTSNTSPGATETRFETCVCHDDGSPTAKCELYPVACSEKLNHRQAYEIVETRIDNCGAIANATSFPQKCLGLNYCTHLESKKGNDGRIATISQRVKDLNAFNDGRQIDGGDRNDVPECPTLSPGCPASQDCTDSLRNRRAKIGDQIRKPSDLQAERCLIKLNKRNGLEPTPSELKRAGCFTKSPAVNRASPISCCDRMKKPLTNHENRRQSCLQKMSGDQGVLEKSTELKFEISHELSQKRKDCSPEIHSSSHLPSSNTVHSKNSTEINDQNCLQTQNDDSQQKIRTTFTSPLCKPIEKSSAENGKNQRDPIQQSEKDGRQIRCEPRSSSEENSTPTHAQATSHFRCERAGKTKFSKESISLPASQELLTCYREYIPEGQLQRYEACRSKRNGLQDECVLPVPRAVIEMRREERRLARQTREDGLVVDKLDVPRSNTPVLTSERSNTEREQDRKGIEFISEHCCE